MASALVGLDLPVVPETILLVALAWPRRSTLERRPSPNVALILLGIISLANAAALVALLGPLISGQEKQWCQLLLKGVTTGGTNVTAYGIGFGGFDRGGQYRERKPLPTTARLPLSEMENPQLAAAGWHPHLVGYIYISFTNSIAFSPKTPCP